MSISVNWGTKVISVPKAYMTETQAFPEVRSLDVEVFFRDLQSLSSQLFEGLSYDIPYSHVTETELSGITYARSIEIINNYLIYPPFCKFHNF